MKKYMFYTTDGYTQDNQLKETENCQLLGIGKGGNITEAYNNLLNENNYIKSHNYENIKAYEVIGTDINL